MDLDYFQLDTICDFGAECHRRGKRFALYADITLWAYDLGWRESEWTTRAPGASLTRARTAT